MTSHLIFDFFGTLVEYSSSRTDQGYPESYAYYKSLGGHLEYSAFIECWAAGFAELDDATANSLREYSMTDAANTFQQHTALNANSDEIARLASFYLQEWNEGVRYIDALPSMLVRLAKSFHLSIVTNTHDPDLVPAHLERMGVSHLFSQVVTSVSFGMRKPSPSIFEFALAGLSVEPNRCVYIGDSYTPDYEGPKSVGIRPLLIDADDSAAVGPHERIHSILGLEAVLAVA